mgnify:CR=1 FL=1
MYESFYKFSAKPFQLNPDPAFYFGSKGHKRAMAYLEYGLHQSEGFIVITGEVGAGKTTLVRNLLRRLDPQQVVAGHLVSTQLDAAETLHMVCAAFGLPSKDADKAELLLGLEMFLLSLSAAGKRALLIVDEAQNLTPRAVEELRMLSNFQVGEHALLQSFLVGQPEFRATMQSPQMSQLRQRVIASYHLGPMSGEETGAYVQHRLRQVGWAGDPAIDEPALSAIHAHSGGIPRRINTLCDRLLLAGFLQGKHAFGMADVNGVAKEIEDENAVPEEALPFADTPLALPADISRLLQDPAAREQAATLLAAFQPSAAEERLARLENAMAGVLALLAGKRPPAPEQAAP